jgi:hypothetical protein
MLKVHTDKNEDTCTINAKGSLYEIANDIALIIHSMYNNYKNGDNDAACAFKLIMQSVVQNDSPIWGAAEGMTAIRIKNPKEGKENGKEED